MMDPDTYLGFESPGPRVEDVENLALSDAPSDYCSAISSFSAASAASSAADGGADPALSLPPPSSYPISPSSPPSYADLFPSTLRSQSQSQSAVADLAAPSGYVAIAVSEPQKEQDAGGIYVSYLVASRSSGGAERRVRRRFREVVALADCLAEAYRGFLVPPRPDKGVVEGQVMQQHEFVELRRAALERYLRRLAAHPAIGRGDELRAFLEAPGGVMDGASQLPKQLLGEGYSAAPHEAANPAKGGRDLFRIFKELKQSVANDWGGAKPPVVEEDRDFLERKEKMQDLEQQLTTSSEQAEALVKAQQDVGETMEQLGRVFVKLTKLETKEAICNSQRTRAADIKRVAVATVKAGRLYRNLNSQVVKHLVALHEYLELMLAVRSAFSDRASALLTVQTLLSDLSSLQARVEKLEFASSKIFGVDRSRLRKLEELKETIRATEDAKSCAVREYERIKEINHSELERLDKERRDDFLSMLKGFVVNQVGFAEKTANAWAGVADETRGYARG